MGRRRSYDANVGLRISGGLVVGTIVAALVGPHAWGTPPDDNATRWAAEFADLEGFVEIFETDEGVVVIAAQLSGELVDRASERGMAVRMDPARSAGAPPLSVNSVEFDAFADAALQYEGLISVEERAGGGIFVTIDPKAEQSFGVDEPGSYQDPKFAMLLSEFGNINVVAGDPIESVAATDVLGGSGVLFQSSTQSAACSAAFSARSASRGDVLISAGHCVNQNGGPRTVGYLGNQTTFPAAGGSTSAALYPLGSVYSWRYGSGPINGHYSDVSLMQVTNSGLRVRPWYATWASPWDHSLSRGVVRDVKEPEPGMAGIIRTGSRTGLTGGGTIAGVGRYLMGGASVDGFAIVAASTSQPGDSGGAILQGNSALGIVSGHNDSYTFAARLDYALEGTDVRVATDIESGLYRFYKRSTGTHFYTANQDEASSLMSSPEFSAEGISGIALTVGQNPPFGARLHRFYKFAAGTHFYTASEYEANLAMGYPDYRYEGVIGVVFSSQVATSVPMYRFYKFAQGTHFYTSSYSEYLAALSYPDYRYEGVTYYVLPVKQCLAASQTQPIRCVA